MGIESYLKLDQVILKRFHVKTTGENVYAETKRSSGGGGK